MTSKQEDEKHRRKKDREAGRCFFSRCFIFFFLMTAEKNKSTDLSSLSFLMVGEAYEMRGSEMRTLKRMKNSVNGNGQRERERERERERQTEIKRESELHNQRRRRNRKALPTAEDPLPTSPPVYS